MASNKTTVEVEGKYTGRGAIQSVGTDMKTLRSAIDATNKSMAKQRNAMRGMRSYASQLGYQIQDIAVQLQGGQNALIVFGQQGSQLASVFGAHGAVVGAIIAVGAAIAGSLLPQVFSASKELKEMETNYDKVFSRMASKGGVDLKLLEDVTLREIVTQIAKIEEASTALSKAKKDLAQATPISEGVEFSVRAILPVLPDTVKEKLAEAFPDDAQFAQMEKEVQASELALAAMNDTLKELEENLRQSRKEQDANAG